MYRYQNLARMLLIILLSASGCTGSTATEAMVTTPLATIEPLPEGTSIDTGPPAAAALSTTQNSLDGNRIVEGSIDLPNASVLDIPVEGQPAWLAGASMGGSALIVAVMDDGTVQAFRITGQAYEPYAISPSQIPAGMPPLLRAANGEAELVVPPEDASPLTNPVLAGGRLVYIAANGDLVLLDSAARTSIPIDALTDGRILVADSNRLLVLTQPTDRYGHGVLGDAVEASGITLVETEPEPHVVRIIPIDSPDVIEGLAPIWADLDGDGGREIIVTLSNDRDGARLAALREDGSSLAEGPPIGRGQRWRHQLAVAEFNPGGPPQLVSVRTPHIGGVVEFLQLVNGHLEIVEEISGFSSHSIGSRNLDSGLAGDFNNDGVVELLVPDQPQTGLGIITPAGVIAAIPLNGTLTSNLSAVVVDGRIVLAAATSGNLRIWLPWIQIP